MHAPPAFAADEQAAFDLIARDGFATLVAVDGAESVASHLPMIADPARGVLRGHLARANPHSAMLDGRRHLAVFVGPNSYISPDWYADAAEVPTWNYLAVHIEGSMRVLTDAAEIDAFLSDLSDFHESRRHDLDSGHFWKIGKLPPEKLPRLRNGIVAFEMAIDKIEAKAKLSQNRSAADVRSVTEKLDLGNETQRAVAEAMERANGGRR